MCLWCALQVELWGAKNSRVNSGEWGSDNTAESRTAPHAPQNGVDRETRAQPPEHHLQITPASGSAPLLLTAHNKPSSSNFVYLVGAHCARFGLTNEPGAAASVGAVGMNQWTDMTRRDADRTLPDAQAPALEHKNPAVCFFQHSVEPPVGSQQARNRSIGG
ncbi:uncharacterized protein YALI1_C18672g [Yarrowia lipolytica]|uniref:Uncharacterized protein n=1 Tax=Yarrowia lipolytica TaxID=4952 RepID=A0A1D8NAZ4_YARLL|nr:hypothetical protein YALI1_C18672g [Yarrowia lipolytica]